MVTLNSTDGVPSVVHLTSVHKRNDVRVFLKMCRSLAKAGFDTYLVVADGHGNAVVDGVKVVDVGAPAGNRLTRMTMTVHRVYRQALSMKADIYHFHDPELIPIGLLLKRAGKVVVFDSHEDYRSDILHKHYVPKLVRKAVAAIYALLENFAAQRLDCIVAATPKIASVFTEIGAKRVVTLNNFPLLEETRMDGEACDKSIDAIFIGAISAVRGVSELVRSLNDANSYGVTLAGPFANEGIQRHLVELEGWRRVDYQGVVDREKVQELLASSKVGIVTYLPAPNHTESQPNKLFEYMGAGIPVVASFFPLWKEIVEGAECGVCVDPESPDAIGEAINFLIEHPQASERMGENGKKAVLEKYNWQAEEGKLLGFYRDLLSLA